jgi:Fe2+ transport system protein B
LFYKVTVIVSISQEPCPQSAALVVTCPYVVNVLPALIVAVVAGITGPVDPQYCSSRFILKSNLYLLLY